MTSNDYYSILEIDDSCSLQDVRQAYRRQAMRWHPDKCSDACAEQMFRSVAEAYQTLSDPDLRADYDRKRRLDDLSRVRSCGRLRPQASCSRRCDIENAYRMFDRSFARQMHTTTTTTTSATQTYVASADVKV